MKQQLRARGRRVVQRIAPEMMQSVEEIADLRKALRDTRKHMNRLRARVAELEREVQENRRLNRRLAELTDVVQELLLPAAQRDDKKLQELLDGYAERL